MNKQMTMSQISDELAEVKTRKKEFLELMNRLIPWGEWEAIIRPCYYKGERGNKPYEIELMLRIHVLQKRYDLSDEGAADEVIDSRAFSQFCGVDSSNQVPDGDTIERFRNILVRNHLEERLFNQVVEKLAACGLLLRKGTIVNSTLISVLSSTHNQEKKCDPEAHSVKKGSQWHFGYKEHVGVVCRLRKRSLFALQMCVLCCDFSRDFAMTWFLDALVRCCLNAKWSVTIK